MSKKNIKEKISVNSLMNGEEFSKLVRYYKKDFDEYKNGYLILAILVSLFVFIFFTLIDSIIVGLILFVIVSLIFIVYFQNNYIRIYTYRYSSKNNEINYHIEFFDNYIETNYITNHKVDYDDIINCIETDTNFYIKYKLNDKTNILNIMKNELEYEEVSLIRKKLFDKLDSHLGEVQEPIIFNMHDLKGETIKIHRLLLGLFIFTILTLWISDYIVDYYSSTEQISFKYVSKLYLIFLVVPISSILFGIIYKKKGYKTTKNIVVGVLVSILLIINSIYYVDEVNTNLYTDYNVINKFKNIINIKLPEYGNVLDASSLFSKYDINNYEYYTISYKSEDVLEIEKDIESDNNWISISNYEYDLNKLFPDNLITNIIINNETSYILIYNETLNEYNKLPNENGIYTIYVCTYSLKNKSLDLVKYDINYIE